MSDVRREALEKVRYELLLNGFAERWSGKWINYVQVFEQLKSLENNVEVLDNIIDDIDGLKRSNGVDTWSAIRECNTEGYRFKITIG